MDVCHDHNLSKPLPASTPYGIRVRLRAGDSFEHLLDDGWETYHWYATPEERDRALADMAAEHLYSRRGDRPAVRFEPVERDAG